MYGYNFASITLKLVKCCFLTVHCGRIALLLFQGSICNRNIEMIYNNEDSQCHCRQQQEISFVGVQSSAAAIYVTMGTIPMVNSILKCRGARIPTWSKEFRI